MNQRNAHPSVGHPVGPAATSYLIARDGSISPQGVDPVDFEYLMEQLDEDPDVQVQCVLHPRDLALQSIGSSVVQAVVVAAMPDSTAAQLAAHPQLIVEEDADVLPLPTPIPLDTPGFVSPFGVQTSWLVRLQDRAGTPQPDATVYLYGSGVPAQGRTDASGTVVLSLTSESDTTLRALYVNPAGGAWSAWIDHPTLISGEPNVITVDTLADTFPGFPAQQLIGWGQRAMGLDRLPADYDGRGVKIGVIDSGAAATTHPDLVGVRHGLDVTTQPPNPLEWTTDSIAHGSHCSGVIAGATTAGGIRGFAPAADMYEARIFPGGRLSSLLDALDYCMDAQVDVVNMSLGTGGTSQIVLTKLAQAKERGVACIVAAGNSAGPVQFPGISPDVFTVAAIGADGTFPEASYHARQRLAGGTPDRGYFAAAFSCHGPEVDVCAPGVAVVSSVPPAGFAAWDGTSMAAPHVTGLAALVLAHHPDFSGPYRSRTAARVDRLFDILRASALPLAFGTERAGAGMPTIAALAAPPTVDDPAADVRSPDAVRAGLARLRQQLVTAGLLT